MHVEKVILLIDDDKDDLQMLKDALKIIDREHQVIEGSDGLDALKTLELSISQQKLPCLIVLDVNMPRLDGKQTFLAIKSNKNLSHIPIVIFSTSTNLMDRTFFERNNTAYFIKPVKFAEFASTASKMMNACYHSSSKEW